MIFGHFFDLLNFFITFPYSDFRIRGLKLFYRIYVNK